MAEIKVVNRISLIFKDEFYRELLAALCSKRNFIAHYGRLPEFDQNELNYVRSFSEEATIFLLNHVNILKDEQTLGFLYDNYLRKR